MKCEYMKICNLYASDSFTCNGNLKSHCGRYKILQRKGIPPLVSTRTAKKDPRTDLHYTTENIPKGDLG